MKDIRYHFSAKDCRAIKSAGEGWSEITVLMRLMYFVKTQSRCGSLVLSMGGLFSEAVG